MSGQSMWNRKNSFAISSHAAKKNIPQQEDNTPSRKYIRPQYSHRSLSRSSSIDSTTAIQIAYLTVTCHRKDEIDRQRMLNANRNLTGLSRFRASGTRQITQRCSF
ncbi:unnamed protein product [Porites lobata]|uniref:Uncharacterized protein n=1 Tax=Porites lobata TaxID=104759 RepID=A0ABN8NB75_9CNID|nr:unnamed protein product [Porites lobata]